MEKAINTFELKGNDYEMGLKQGKTFQRQIRNFYKDLTTSDEFLASKPILFPRFLFKRLATLFSSRMIRKSIQQYFPSQWNFLKGLSKATDLSINKILFLQAIDALGAQITHYRVGEISSSLNNCSAVGITGEVSSTDGVLIVKNWDGPDFLAKCCIFRNIYPKNDNKFSTIGSGVIGLVGINNGMNEKGLSIVYNYVYLKDIGKEGIPPMIIIRGALENCSSVKEAISYFQQFPLLGGANIMVGDINGDLAILELSPKKMEVRREGFDGISSYLIITNHFLIPSMKELEIPKNSVYDEKAAKSLQNKLVHQSSILRYKNAKEVLMQSPDKISLDYLNKEIQCSHGNKNKPSEFTFCNHGTEISTGFGVMIDIKNRQFYATLGNPCQVKMKRLE